MWSWTDFGRSGTWNHGAACEFGGSFASPHSESMRWFDSKRPADSATLPAFKIYVAEIWCFIWIDSWVNQFTQRSWCWHFLSSSWSWWSDQLSWQQWFQEWKRNLWIAGSYFLDVILERTKFQRLKKKMNKTQLKMVDLHSKDHSNDSNRQSGFTLIV